MSLAKFLYILLPFLRISQASFSLSLHQKGKLPSAADGAHPGLSGAWMQGSGLQAWLRSGNGRAAVTTLWVAEPAKSEGANGQHSGEEKRP